MASLASLSRHASFASLGISSNLSFDLSDSLAWLGGGLHQLDARTSNLPSVLALLEGLQQLPLVRDFEAKLALSLADHTGVAHLLEACEEMAVAHTRESTMNGFP